MPYRAQIDDRGVITKYKDTDTGEVISAKEFERRMTAQSGGYYMDTQVPHQQQMYAVPPQQQGMYSGGGVAPAFQYSQQNVSAGPQGFAPMLGSPQAAGIGQPAVPMAQAPQAVNSMAPAAMPGQMPGQMAGQMPGQMPMQAAAPAAGSPL